MATKKPKPKSEPKVSALSEFIELVGSMRDKWEFEPDDIDLAPAKRSP